MIETNFALHIHTNYSDGRAKHLDLVKLAAQAGLDGIITTDHNIWVDGVEGYYGEKRQKVILLVGEEIHNRKLSPQGNHLLAIGARKELSPLGETPQRLIDQINRSDGCSFLAHPVEDPLSLFGELAYPWRDWDIQHFTGIELWNQMSEFKSVTTDYLSAFIHALFPKRMTTGPLEKTLALWDDLIRTRKRPIVAVGGVDAHNIHKRIGPFTIQLYPYLHHFKSITTHLLLPKPLSGVFEEDRKSIIRALKSGHCFVAYDLPHPTRGFRFSVNTDDGQFIMGDEFQIKGGLTFQIRLPKKTRCRLFRNGSMIKEWEDRDVCTHITTDPGVYRVEVYIPYKGKLRGWIFSNPIYVWPNP
jgi:predicted metal-dependent phosphoesterase TrpH